MTPTRQAFETWASSQNVDLFKYHSGAYYYAHTRQMWDAWEACAKLDGVPRCPECQSPLGGVGGIVCSHRHRYLDADPQSAAEPPQDTAPDPLVTDDGTEVAF